MDLGLRGKHAVVTGGSAGIGAAVVAVLAQEGCRVSFCARRRDRIEGMLATLQARRVPAGAADGVVSGAVVDVTDRPAMRAWLDGLGTIDLVVANVSALSASWEATIATDLTSTIYLAEQALQRIARGGALTYVGSKVSSYETSGFEAYGAIKAAMAHYIKSIAAKLPETGIRVNVVSPGDTLFPGGSWDTVRRDAPDRYAATLRANPLGRLADPEEIARVIAFISSPAASFVNGANWYVDGGSTRHTQF